MKIPAKEIDGELWVRAADHHKAIKEALEQREWQGLTDEEVENFVKAIWPPEAKPADFIRAIENKIKEKNL